MTEVVQKRMELLAEEMEEMQRIKLITPEEAKALVTKRREFEHAIHSVTKSAKCYTDYISYEKYLLRDLHLRRNKYKIFDKKNSIETKIIKRVKLLYQFALQRFPNAIPVFLDYLKFCKKIKHIEVGTQAVKDMLQNHPENTELWQVASSWHAYDRNDPQSAMMILMKGIAIHRDCQMLYREIILIELAEGQKAEGESAAAVEKLCAAKLEAIISTICENIKECKFYIDILALLEEHDFTMGPQTMIIEHMVKEFKSDENVWHVLAQRERKDLSYDFDTNKHVNLAADDNEDVEMSTTKKRTPKARLEACFSMYKQGLATVPPSSKRNLWSLYLDFLLKLQHDPFAACNVFKQETFKAALLEGSQEGCLSENHFLAWLELVGEDERLAIAEKATEAIPQSVDLWKARLRLQIAREDPDEIDIVFKLAIQALKEKALPLWSAIIRFHYLEEEDERIEDIFVDAISQPAEISSVIKPQYLEWLALTKGIEKAREVYRKLSVEKPYCKNLHVMMEKLEWTQIDPNFEIWGQVHKLCCEQFGHTDIEVWISYIQFYLQHNKTIPDLNEQVQRIKKQAMETISKELSYEFMTRYKQVTDAA